MRTKNLYGINSKSNSVEGMYVTTCVTNKPQMNPLRQLFLAQLATSKRLEIWQTLRFTNKL